MSMNHVDYLDIARVIASHGTCSRLQVGAVLVKDKRIISTGYNGAPSGVEHCRHYGVSSSEFTGCTVAVHAEVNAIVFAARHGIATEGTFLYTTNLPCLDCARQIINAGILKVVYANGYRSSEGQELLEKVGIPVSQVDGSRLFLLPTIQRYFEGMYPRESRLEDQGRTPDSLS